MRIFTYIIVILAILLGVSFAILNAEAVSLNYYIGTAETPLSLLLVITLGIGLLFGLLASLFTHLRLRRQISQLKHRLKLAEKEVSNLRAIPISDSH